MLKKEQQASNTLKELINIFFYLFIDKLWAKNKLHTKGPPGKPRAKPRAIPRAKPLLAIFVA